MAFTLFGTDGCHLCEDAGRLLQQAATRYGIRIPVIRHDGSCDELGWPFDFAHLLSWLTVHHSPEKEN